MNTPNNYRQVYKNLGTAPRTLSEANKDADYATPLWRCENDMDKGFKFLGEAFAGFVFIALPVGALALFSFWLLKVV